jgi:tetratricopeptide (TPR) repeat protein
MTKTPSRLDADELLYLAMAAAKQDRHEDAIDYLKRAIEMQPNHAKAHYFLAAEHAQIGMYDRAVEEMEKSVQLDPSLHTAHFQLGLLHLTSGRVAEAVNAWQALDQLGESDPLFQFKKGLECMANDQFDACREYLTKGIALNRVNPDLNIDMQRVLDELPAQGTDTRQVAQTGHVFLSAYTNDKDSQ